METSQHFKALENLLFFSMMEISKYPDDGEVQDYVMGSAIVPSKDAIPALQAHIKELKDALLWSLNQIEDDLDPDHQAALAASYQLVGVQP